MKSKPNFVLSIIVISLILFFAALYILSINPYWKITPDSAVYVLAAESIAGGSGYQIEASPAVLFPPITSLILAPFLALFSLNYYIPNALVILSALLSMLVFYILTKRTAEPDRSMFVIALTLGNIVFFQYCTFILSDIFYMLFSFLALLAIKTAGERRETGWISYGIIGITVWLACMTRMPGISLASAGIVYWYITRRRGELNAAGSPAFLFIMVAAIMLVVLWEIRNIHSGASYIKLFLQKESWVNEAGFLSFFGILKRAFFNIPKFLLIVPMVTNGLSGLNGLAQHFIEFLVLLFLVIGVIRAFRNNVSMEILYVGAYLLVIEPFELSPVRRHFVPVIPFLFYYTLAGFDHICEKFNQRHRETVTRACKTAGIAAIGLYFSTGVFFMVPVLGELHTSPFGSYPIKNFNNFDAQKLALWLRANSSPADTYATQHVIIMDIFTQRKGRHIPFSYDADGIVAYLRKKGIKYVLVDKNEQMMQKFCIPAIEKRRDAFLLIKDEPMASIYEVR